MAGRNGCIRPTPTCFQTFQVLNIQALRSSACIFSKSSGSPVWLLQPPPNSPPTFKKRAVMVFPKPYSHHPAQGLEWQCAMKPSEMFKLSVKMFSNVHRQVDTHVQCNSTDSNVQQCQTLRSSWWRVNFEPYPMCVVAECKGFWPMSVLSHPWPCHPPNHPHCHLRSAAPSPTKLFWTFQAKTLQWTPHYLGMSVSLKCTT